MSSSDYKNKSHNIKLSELKQLKQMRSIEGEIIKLSSQKDILELELEDLRKEYDRECSYLKKVLRQQTDDVQKEIKQNKNNAEQKLEQELKFLEDKIKHVKDKKNNELTKLECKLQDKKNIIKNLKDEIAQLTQDQISINQQITQEIEEKNELSISVHNLQKKEHEFKQKLSEEHVQFNDLVVKSQSLFKKVQESGQALNSHRQEVAQLKRRTTAKVKEKKSLTKSILKQQNVTERNQLLIDQKLEKLSKTESVLNQKSLKLQEINHQLKDQQDQLNESIKKHAQLEANSHQLSISNKESQKILEAISLERISVESKLRVLKEEFDFGQQKYKELKIEISSMESSLHFLQSKKNQLKKVIDEQELQKEDLEAKSNTLYEQLQELEAQVESKKYLEQSITKEIVSLEKQRNELFPIVNNLELKNKNQNVAQEKINQSMQETSINLVKLKNNQYATQDEIKRLDGIKEALHEQILSQQDEIDLFNKVVCSHDQLIEQKNDQLEQIKLEKLKLTQEVESIEKQTQEFEEKINLQLERYEIATKRNDEEAQKLQDIQEHIKQLEEKRKSIYNNYIELEKETSEKIKELDSTFAARQNQLDEQYHQQQQEHDDKIKQLKNKFNTKEQELEKEYESKSNEQSKFIDQLLANSDSQRQEAEKEFIQKQADHNEKIKELERELQNKLTAHNEKLEEQKQEFKEKVFQDILNQLRHDLTSDELLKLKQKPTYQEYYRVKDQTLPKQKRPFWMGVASSAAVVILFMGATFFFPDQFVKARRGVASVLKQPVAEDSQSNQDKTPQPLFYQPQKDNRYKETTLDNTLKTQKFVETWQNVKFQQNINTALKDFLLKKYQLSSNEAQTILSLELNFIYTVNSQGAKIEYSKKDFELQRLKILEVQKSKKIIGILGEPAHYNEYKKFVKNYYLNYTTKKQ